MCSRPTDIDGLRCLRALKTSELGMGDKNSENYERERRLQENDCCKLTEND
jgi:hypothetical protein